MSSPAAERVEEAAPQAPQVVPGPLVVPAPQATLPVPQAGAPQPGAAQVILPPAALPQVVAPPVVAAAAIPEVAVAPVSAEAAKDAGGKQNNAGVRFFIGGLPAEAEDRDLREYFSKYGELSEAQVIKDRGTGRSRNFGFVAIKDASQQDSVLGEKIYICGRHVDVRIHKEGDAGGDRDRSRSRDRGRAGGKKVFIGRLEQNMSQDSLRDAFSKEFGGVSDVFLATGKKFGFVTFKSAKTAQVALDAGSLKVDGANICIKTAEPMVRDGRGRRDRSRSRSPPPAAYGAYPYGYPPPGYGYPSPAGCGYPYGYPPTAYGGYPGAPPPGMPGMPPQGMPGMPPPGMPGMPPQGMPGMTPPGSPGMPPQGMPPGYGSPPPGYGYPPSPYGYGYPSPGAPGAPPGGSPPGYPPMGYPPAGYGAAPPAGY